MTKEEIDKYCYNKWLNSPKTFNHFKASQLLKKELIKRHLNNDGR